MSNEAMKTILNEYLAANPAADAELLSSFCTYAEKWFVESNVVGVGVTAEGVSLRLGDGTETQLFVAASTVFPETPAVCVTGTDVIGPPAQEVN